MKCSKISEGQQRVDDDADVGQSGRSSATAEIATDWTIIGGSALFGHDGGNRWGHPVREFSRKSLREQQQQQLQLQQ